MELPRTLAHVETKALSGVEGLVMPPFFPSRSLIFSPARVLSWNEGPFSSFAWKVG